jgi:hypothetical protein
MLAMHFRGVTNSCETLELSKDTIRVLASERYSFLLSVRSWNVATRYSFSKKVIVLICSWRYRKLISSLSPADFITRLTVLDEK